MNESNLIPLNLQLFGEGDAFSGDVVDPGTDSGIETETDIDDEQDTDTGDESGGSDDTSDSGAVDQKPKQTPEQDAAFAQMRRDAEAAKARAKRADDLIAAQYGESHGIYTLEQYEAAVSRQEADAQRQELEQAGIDPNLINQMVSNHPAIKQATAFAAQQQKQAQDMKLVAEFEELAAEYPDLIKTPDDVDDKVAERYNKGGLTMLEAYELVHRNTLKTRQANAAKQKALNNLQSKSHLSTEGDGASDGLDVHVPSETLQMYMDMGMDKKSAIAYHKKLYG